MFSFLQVIPLERQIDFPWPTNLESFEQNVCLNGLTLSLTCNLLRSPVQFEAPKNNKEGFHRQLRWTLFFASSVQSCLHLVVRHRTFAQEEHEWGANSCLVAETNCTAAGGCVKLKTPKSSSSVGCVEGERATDLTHQKKECRYLEHFERDWHKTQFLLCFYWIKSSWFYLKTIWFKAVAQTFLSGFIFISSQWY